MRVAVFLESASAYVSLCVVFCSLVGVGQAQSGGAVGCVSNSFVEEHYYYYRLDETVTRSGCSIVCSRRLTTHYAVSDGLKPAKQQLRCYCGNDLLSVSSAVDESKCASCYPESAKKCGSEHTMSVYKLSDSTPLAFLYGKITDRSFLNVSLYRHDLRRSVDLMTTQGWPKVGEIRGASDIDFEYNKNIIFFSTNQNVFKSYLVKTTGRYGDIRDIPSVGLNTLVNTRGVATDWVTGILYWANCDREDKCDICHHNETCINIRDGGLNMFVIDPLTRTAFVLSQYQTVSTYDLDSGRFLKTIELNVNFTVIAVDVHTQLLYAGYTRTETNGANSQHIVSMKYDGSSVKPVLGGNKIANIRVLDIDGDQMLWTNCVERGRFNCAVYRCTLTSAADGRSTCSESDIELLFEENLRITDIRIFHPYRQTPSLAFICKQLGCSHTCERLTRFTARCTCPNNMKLTNENTCQGTGTTPMDTPGAAGDAQNCNAKLQMQAQTNQNLTNQLDQLRTENSILHKEVQHLQQTIQRLQGKLTSATSLLKSFDAQPCSDGWFFFSVGPCAQSYAQRQTLKEVLNSS